MPLFVIPFPEIDPVLVQFGPFAVRWYALAYIAGLVIGWRVALRLVDAENLWGNRARPDRLTIDDLLIYWALGIVLGGRLGNVIFYDLDYYLTYPSEILAIWHGGMSFHGGLIGAVIAMMILARMRKVSALALFDVAAIVAPIGLFFGRIANFINGELWGKIADVPWAVIFPQSARPGTRTAACSLRKSLGSRP